jgi:voltage-gated potassium channel
VGRGTILIDVLYRCGMPMTENLPVHAWHERLRQHLTIMVEVHDTPLSRRFDLAIQSLIILSIIVFSIETLPNIPPQLARWLAWIESMIVVAFTVEYLLRIYTAPRKWDYIFSFYGLVDVLSILPFYVGSGIDLVVLRILRMLRLFRIMKLVRYNNAMQRLIRAFRLAYEEIVLFSVVTMMLLYLASVGIYFFEHEAQPDKFASVLHSMWWAVATLTTVGYGDIYPITPGGKIFTFIILMIGLGIVAVPTGMMSSALLKVREEEQAQREQSPAMPDDTES